MCTVTVIPTPRGHRLVCNRDEHRARPASGELAARTLGERAAVMPIDPPSGGTWIGANDAGLVACLLNANPGAARVPASRWAGRRSRGLIVPAALREHGIEDALRVAIEMDARGFPPFRLLLLQDGRHALIASDGASMTASLPRPLGAALLLTSSGLGDGLVDPLRRGLFLRMTKSGATSAVQDRFHAHRWPDRPHLSVLMSRPDARTVSRTIIETAPEGTSLRHAWLADDLSEAGATVQTLAHTTTLQAA